MDIVDARWVEREKKKMATKHIAAKLPTSFSEVVGNSINCQSPSKHHLYSVHVVG